MGARTLRSPFRRYLHLRFLRPVELDGWRRSRGHSKGADPCNSAHPPSTIFLYSLRNSSFFCTRVNATWGRMLQLWTHSDMAWESAVHPVPRAPAQALQSLGFSRLHFCGHRVT